MSIFILKIHEEKDAISRGNRPELLAGCSRLELRMTNPGRYADDLLCEIASVFSTYSRSSLPTLSIYPIERVYGKTRRASGPCVDVGDLFFQPCLAVYVMGFHVSEF